MDPYIKKPRSIACEIRVKIEGSIKEVSPGSPAEPLRLCVVIIRVKVEAAFASGGHVRHIEAARGEACVDEDLAAAGPADLVEEDHHAGAGICLRPDGAADDALGIGGQPREAGPGAALPHGQLGLGTVPPRRRRRRICRCCTEQRGRQQQARQGQRHDLLSPQALPPL